MWFIACSSVPNLKAGRDRLCPGVEASEVGRGEAIVDGVCPGIAGAGRRGACLEVEKVAEDGDDSGGVDGE